MADLVVLKLKEEGNKLFKEGNFAKAREKYTEALKHDSSNSVIYSNRSLTSIKMKDYELALTDATESIKHNPKWSKGFLRKAMALQGLNRHREVLEYAVSGFDLADEAQIKRDFISLWLNANKILNSLPEGCIDLPRGIIIMSEDYLCVLGYLMQSLSGKCPLSLSLTEQCLFNCAQQTEKILLTFGGSISPVIKDWMEHLPNEVYPYSTNPVAKAKLEKDMKSRSEEFVKYLDKDVDPALYPLLRPILGLVVLVVLNRTNILTECNTGHHAVELMNRALLPLFEACILSTEDYYSLYIRRLCAVVDSFIGRGYRLDDKKLTAVRSYCNKLDKAVREYPKGLPESECLKDKQLAERALSNASNNILQPASLSPPKIPESSTMSVEKAAQLVKLKPLEVKAYIIKHLRDLDTVEFLTMGEVEELLTMTGIFIELRDEGAALDVFAKGEQAFFRVLGHMLGSNTLTLDQCSATIAPMRQLALNQASMLKETGVFADVILRWKCLFKELRTQMIYSGSGDRFSAFFQWYAKQLTSSEAASPENTESALLKQLQEEEKLLQTCAESALLSMATATYQLMEEYLSDGTATVDYIFFAPMKENPLLDAYCVVSERGATPQVCQLDYKAIRNQSALVNQLMSSIVKGQSAFTSGRINAELSILAKVLLPPCLIEILESRRINHLYISPDSNIVRIPMDLLPVSLNSSASSDPPIPIFERFSVSILPSMRELFWSTKKSESTSNRVCTIVGNPDFNLSKPVTESISSSIQWLIKYFCGYFSLSASTKHTLDLLTYSQDEIDFISLHLESHGFLVKKFIGDQATLSNILSIECPMLLHVSSHAYSEEGTLSAFRGNFFEDLKSSAIALAGYNTFTRGEFDQIRPDCGPAQLPPLAIFSLKLQGTKLVYLSTCNSASGTAPMQESVDNLAEAFLVAGAETVIASLWPVQDELACDFCKLFYEELSIPGVRPSQALSSAKKHFKMFTNIINAPFLCYGLDKPFL